MAKFYVYNVVVLPKYAICNVANGGANECFSFDYAKLCKIMQNDVN